MGVRTEDDITAIRGGGGRSESRWWWCSRTGGLLRKGLAASGDHPGADEVEGEVGYKLEQQINSAASCPKIARYAAD
jgi:hypothetical protein